MNENPTYGLVVAGVGGQGAVTVAQLILGAAWMDGYHVLQSEVHGMSQRGGEVSAHIVFSKDPVMSPTIEQGDADFLLGLEPLETLRHLIYLKKDANFITSMTTIENMEHYPASENILSLLKCIDGVKLIDSDLIAKELHFSHGANMTLLGYASNYLPVKGEVWDKVIRERFASKGEKIVDKNLLAFNTGKKLINNENIVYQ